MSIVATRVSATNNITSEKGKVVIRIMSSTFYCDIENEDMI